MKNLWGERFFNPDGKKWQNSGDGKLKRGFCQFVLDPIYKVFDCVMNVKKEETTKLLDKLNIKLTAEERDLEAKPLLKVC